MVNVVLTIIKLISLKTKHFRQTLNITRRNFTRFILVVTGLCSLNNKRLHQAPFSF
jgi:hypothetical protein